MVVWDAALVLAYFLQRHSQRFLLRGGDKGGRRVLELGAGTGAVGIVAAIFGCDFVAWDRNQFPYNFVLSIGMQG